MAIVTHCTAPCGKNVATPLPEAPPVYTPTATATTTKK
jgi:hypothetical protein